MTPPSATDRRLGLGWSLIGSGWALFVAAILIGSMTSSGVPSVTELGKTGRLWVLLPMVAAAGLLVLFGCRHLAGRWFGFLPFIPLFCVGGFFATIAAYGEAMLIATGDRVTCTVVGEEPRSIPRNSNIRGWYRVTCPDAEHVIPWYQGDDDSRRKGDRVEVIRDPDGEKTPVIADTVGPDDLLMMILIPFVLVVAPPIVVGRSRGAWRRPRRLNYDDPRGPFQGNWPTPPGGPAH